MYNIHVPVMVQSIDKTESKTESTGMPRLGVLVCFAPFVVTISDDSMGTARQYEAACPNADHVSK